MLYAVEYTVFGIIMGANLGLGLFFSFKKSGSLTTNEMFLGSRTIKMLPLALSMLASIMSSTGIVGFTGHFYTYGLHMGWCVLTTILLFPVTVHVVVPVMYKLKVTSIFEVSVSGRYHVYRNFSSLLRKLYTC
ncbi:hypothetical protein HPB47_025636 [Ixodes persulcatus]|uniref:Uncharacterized protein n=1 Tax=Ixodes persulcatus TaxID=34615 RepID=A0AC60Q2S0_IXOPE|nr:hypothetical protein HPB47_025636 [Ixodes persulcatus]